MTLEKFKLLPWCWQFNVKNSFNTLVIPTFSKKFNPWGILLLAFILFVNYGHIIKMSREASENTGF